MEERSRQGVLSQQHPRQDSRGAASHGWARSGAVRGHLVVISGTKARCSRLNIMGYC